MLEKIADRFRKVVPKNIDFCAVRIVQQCTESLSISRGVLQPPTESFDLGLMITVFHQGQFVYSATSDCSEIGIANAIDSAQNWLVNTRLLGVNYNNFEPKHLTGEYCSPVDIPWSSVSLQDKVQQLDKVQQFLCGHDNIVNWYVGLKYSKTESLYVTHGGGEIFQTFERLVPSMSVAANKKGMTLNRSSGGGDFARQGGLEILQQFAFEEKSQQLKSEVLQLLDAPNCPDQQSDLILMPDQMILQIHESIGHPLELDRILGDERNYAGTSFVDLDMFGNYQYGSELLNVSFDPSIDNQLASYNFDDDGKKAEKVFVIENGILKQPLGGDVSVARVNKQSITGTANTRATNWNRPPLDRMANLNVEPGTSTREDIVANTENGILMETNCSWSIDDSRNKFQFGCELGRVIKDGELKHLVRTPNYRGISATFWRNLVEVGDSSTFDIYGTPYCGKAEPNQMITVGHASPICRFSNVDIFGGEE